MAHDRKRTKGIHLYFPEAAAARLEVERDTLRTYENGDQFVVRGSDQRIVQSLAELGAAPLPGGPVTLSTYGELLAFVAETCGSELEAKHAAAAAERQRKSEEAAAEHAARVAREIEADKNRKAKP